MIYGRPVKLASRDLSETIRTGIVFVGNGDTHESVHTEDMAHATHPDKLIHIPLSEREAVSLLGRVKPTADMPRQGAHPMKAKKARKRKK